MCVFNVFIVRVVFYGEVYVIGGCGFYEWGVVYLYVGYGYGCVVNVLKFVRDEFKW